MHPGWSFFFTFLGQVVDLADLVELPSFRAQQAKGRWQEKIWLVFLVQPLFPEIQMENLKAFEHHWSCG